MKTRNRITLASTITVLTAGAVVLSAPLAASAHVGVTPSTTAAGSYTVLTFGVPHGCDGSSTTSLTFDIPDEIVAVTPTVNPNWTIEKVMDGERVDSVVYTAITPLLDGYRDTMQLSLQLPEDAAGETLAFPVAQACEVGSTDWSEIAEEGQDPHDLEHPAPLVEVTAAESEHGAAAVAAVADTAPVAAEPDVLARTLGTTGLALGVVSIVLLIVLLLKRGGPRAAGAAQDATKEQS